MRIRPTVQLPLRDHAAFLSNYYHQGGLGGVFVPGNTRVQSADLVDLEILFAQEQVVVHSRGVVRWKRLTGTKRLPAGIGVDFADSEGSTRDLLLDFANGKEVKLHHRQTRRYPAMMDVHYASGSVLLSDVTDDVSRDGLRILTDQLLPIGTELALALHVPDQTKPLKLRGVVRWHQTEGRKGMGVRFIFDDEKVHRQLIQMIEEIKHRLAEELGAPR